MNSRRRLGATEAFSSIMEDSPPRLFTNSTNSSLNSGSFYNTSNPSTSSMQYTDLDAQPAQLPRWSTPRQPLQQHNHNAASGFPSSDQNPDLQGIYENFNAIQDSCENITSSQQELKESILMKLANLENKVDESVRLYQQHQQLPSQSNASSKMRTPLELSMRIKQLCADDQTLAFDALSGWNVAHNINKREKIIDQLRLKFENKYSEKEYQFAVRRAYENQRIRAREAANMTLKAKNTKNKRSHTLRWQTMKRRGRVVDGEEERAIWKEVQPELMSDEEEQEDGSLLLRSPRWRAVPLNELVIKLDQRLNDRGITDRLVKQRHRATVFSLRNKPNKHFSASCVI